MGFLKEFDVEIHPSMAVYSQKNWLVDLHELW